MNNPMRTFGKYQTSSKSVELEMQDIVGELKINLSVKLFCGSLHKEELKENGKARLISKRFVMTN